LVEWVEELFEVTKPVIGVVHLKPLPGSPFFSGSLEEVYEAALRDAKALYEGGVDGLIVENFNDYPFLKSRVGPEVIATMSAIVRDIVKEVRLPVGVNVLRNDGIAAIAIAYATGASYVRINAYTDVLVTEQGIVEPCAAEALRYRKYLSCEVKVLADILCKHAYPLVPLRLEEAIFNAVIRGRADAIIITGERTGIEPNLMEVKKAKEVTSGTPIFVGSGLRPDNVKEYLKYADGAIVGTWFKKGGDVSREVDVKRVREFMDKVREVRKWGRH